MRRIIRKHGKDEKEKEEKGDENKNRKKEPAGRENK